ncbi:uncharacterized protein LOC119657392 isoform X2 [Hermetia illucens]|uniref:uncharacterized protein LOC119657392 isoform X2 n=1 Tax=Hermetia illucens TaxID=343691 RepID=UPI0018CC44EC|nr:uncharacterized protein LOC119657392 isoform X2 [Hermetia illucens]
MQGFKWSLSLVIVAVVLQTICAMPSIRVKRQDIEEIQEPSDLSDDLNPIEVEVSDTDGLDREKRKLPDGKFAAKNAIIGFVFSSSKQTAYASADASRLKRYNEETEKATDAAELDRNKVSLEIPDELFSSSFRTVTNISKMFGDLITNSARRYAQFVRYLKPVLGGALIVKGYEPTTTTTTTTEATSDSNSV